MGISHSKVDWKQKLFDAFERGEIKKGYKILDNSPIDLNDGIMDYAFDNWSEYLAGYLLKDKRFTTAHLYIERAIKQGDNEILIEFIKNKVRLTDFQILTIIRKNFDYNYHVVEELAKNYKFSLKIIKHTLEIYVSSYVGYAKNSAKHYNVFKPLYENYGKKLPFTEAVMRLFKSERFSHGFGKIPEIIRYFEYNNIYYTYTIRNYRYNPNYDRTLAEMISNDQYIFQNLPTEEPEESYVCFSFVQDNIEKFLMENDTIEYSNEQISTNLFNCRYVLYKLDRYGYHLVFKMKVTLSKLYEKSFIEKKNVQEIYHLNPETRSFEKFVNFYQIKLVLNCKKIQRWWRRIN